MTLSDEQAISIVEKHPNGKFIQFLQNKYKVMRSHITGIGAESLINQIQGFERENIMKARKKMMLSNKDLLTRVLKPRQKIYSAKGGIESFNLATSEQIQEYKEFLSNCAGKRTSLKQYISNEVQKAYDMDPMGLKWIGVNEFGEPYPTYKCIMSIYDFVVNDGTPEYVIFKSTQAEIDNYIAQGIITGEAANTVNLKCYRCVCDGFERIIVWLQDIKVVAKMTNPFGEVQGEVVSDIITEDENGFKYYESDLYNVSELLSQYVFARSIYNIAYSQTAYPMMWMQKQACPTCGGKKHVGGSVLNGGAPNDPNLTCPECKGTGVYPHFQNSDTFIWEFSKDVNGNVPVPPLGIIETAIDNLEYMKQEKVDIETLVNETLWGVAKVAPNTKVASEAAGKPGNNTSETAFEANLNEEPKKDKLKEYSRWLANTIKWYADTMGKFKYETAYISSAILCGDRYGVESPDEILTRITKAKAAGTAQAILESLQMEYFETKYENNPLELRKAKIYYLGEPYFFFQVNEVSTWDDIPKIQVLEKKMWGEFMCTLTDQVVASIPDDNILPTIQKMVREYVIDRYNSDKATDALLFANDGSILNIGDNARVKVNLAKDPKHLGSMGKVTNITADKVTLSLDGAEVPYERSSLERVFNS